MKYLSVIILPCLLLTGFSPVEVSPVVKDSRSQFLKTSVEDQFSFMRCHRQGKKIAVTWGLDSEFDVDHYLIYHSDDGDFFNIVGEVPADGSRRYTFLHDYMFPGYHHYKVVAVMNSSPSVESIVDVVRIVSHG